MITKYYLLRKNQETLLGPHTLSEIASLYKSKRCSINDEVSGNLGPWVYLKKRDELKRYYPEMLNIFHAASPKENLVSIYDKYETPPAKTSALKGFALVIFILLIGGAAAAAFYLYQRHKSDTLQRIVQHYRSHNYPRAMEILNANPRLVEMMTASLTNSKKWLPLLRTFVFERDVMFKPAVMAIIREQSAVRTPADCSRSNWQKIWSASIPNWGELLTHQKLPAEHWSLLLSWDNAWLRERNAPHWQYPNSYEHGCFLSAYHAFVGMSLPATSLATTIRERIMWQARVLNSTADDHNVVQPETPSPLLVWNCMEQSRDLKTLDACRRNLKNARRTPLIAYSYEKYHWNKLRILAMQLKTGSTTNFSMPPSASSVDSYNAIDYRGIVDQLANIIPKK